MYKNVLNKRNRNEYKEIKRNFLTCELPSIALKMAAPAMLYNKTTIVRNICVNVLLDH